MVRNDIPNVFIHQIATYFRGEQDAIKVNNLIWAHWLNILCKRGDVSNGAAST